MSNKEFILKIVEIVIPYFIGWHHHRFHMERKAAKIKAETGKEEG